MVSSISDREIAYAPCELESCQGFLLAFVNSKLPMSLRRYVGASDVVQSVMFTANRRRDQFLGTSDGEFQAWLIRIARGKIVDGIRKYRLREVHLPERSFPSCISGHGADFHETPSVQMANNEQAIELLCALEQLPPEVREIVSYRYSESLTFEQIGLKMNLPASTCRRRWLEGCQLLRQRLSHLFS